MHKTFYLAACLFLFSCLASAGSGLAFLEIPVGARENALGGAGVALSTGPTSSAYNPAALAYTKRSAAFMDSRHFGDTHAQFIGATFHAGSVTVTPHYWGTRVPDIEYRTSPTRDPIGTFDATGSVFGASLAYEIRKYLAVGATGRYLYQKISTESSDGFLADLGALYHTKVRGLSLGLAVNHLGHVNEFVSQTPKLPTAVRVGASFYRDLSNYGRLMATGEAVNVRGNDINFRGGVEYSAPRFAAFRVGYVTGLEAQNLSLGLGLFYKQLHIDYAFIPYQENLGEGHRFSVALEF